ncbi:MAG TPA: pentapeptide repeat-containing protein [Anaerolineales bacterium]|nr:pentapeptide repeat-containing protein [Anaerolineales bacterium]HNA56287.1 pentapeptide repeat-containing protein [Anaerolineales bacterium]HNB87593.1 pentapeptide repeat-containing protein [Anaerolineales bacterium]
MADQKHREIFSQGRKVWNAWRKKNPKIKPDLSTLSFRNADLGGFDLRAVFLENSDLRNAQCVGTDLRGAYLYNVDARKANFDKANLSGATLQRALFQGASLRNAKIEFTLSQEANFEKADLTNASLFLSDLSDAKFDQAILKNANFNETNLNGTYLTQCDLSSCTFKKASLVNVKMVNSNLTGVDFSGRTLAGASFWRANLTRANIKETDCQMVEFAEAKLVGANLSFSNLDTAEFRDADLTSADLHGSYLANTSLLRAVVEKANFKNCYVYGTSAWDLIGTPKSQQDLIITPPSEPAITVDDLEVAQFVYLVYNNKKIRNFMNAFTDKNVLILGRFSLPERKAVLDGLREKLRTFDFVPIVFDFDSPQDKDYTETVQTLAGMSMFVIVDVTNPKSTPLEMEATVKQFKIPYLPIIDTSADDRPFAMMIDLQKSFHWVLPTFGYKTKKELLNNLKAAIIDRAIEKHDQLRDQKAKESISMLTVDDLKKRSGAKRKK